MTAQVKSLEEAQIHIDAIWRELRAIRIQVQRLEEENDTFLRTVWWRRWLFIVDGWSGHRVVDRPKWRPWRRWYTS